MVDNFRACPASIDDDERLTEPGMSDFAKLFAERLVTRADDWGRADGDASFHSRYWRLDVETIERLYCELEQFGFIERYTPVGKKRKVAEIIGYHEMVGHTDRVKYETHRNAAIHPERDGYMIPGKEARAKDEEWKKHYRNESFQPLTGDPHETRTRPAETRTNPGGVVNPPVCVLLPTADIKPLDVETVWSLFDAEKNNRFVENQQLTGDPHETRRSPPKSFSEEQVTYRARGGPTDAPSAVGSGAHPIGFANKERARVDDLCEEAGSGEPTASGGGTAAAFGRGPSAVEATNQPVLASGTPGIEDSDLRRIVDEAETAEAASEHQASGQRRSEGADEPLLGPPPAELTSREVTDLLVLSPEQAARYNAWLVDAGPEARWPSPAHEAEAMAWWRQACVCRTVPKGQPPRAPLPAIPEAWFVARFKALAHIAHRDGADRFIEALQLSRQDLSLLGVVQSPGTGGSDAGPLSIFDVLTHATKYGEWLNARRIHVAKLNLFKQQTGRLMPRAGEELPELSPQALADAINPPSKEELDRRLADKEESERWERYPWSLCPMEFRGDKPAEQAWYAERNRVGMAAQALGS